MYVAQCTVFIVCGLEAGKFVPFHKVAVPSLVRFARDYFLLPYPCCACLLRLPKHAHCLCLLLGLYSRILGLELDLDVASRSWTSSPRLLGGTGPKPSQGSTAILVLFNTLPVLSY